VQRVGLDQQTVELQGAEQEFEDSALMGFAGIKQDPGDRHTQLAGVERDLGDKPRRAIGAIKLCCRTTQCLAVANQLLDFPVLIGDLGENPLPE
jgi:hypothetical protein